MDFEPPNKLSDQELLDRLRELGDTNTKAVTVKNRQILEKKLNHLVAAARKKEREAQATINARSRSPRRTPVSTAKSKIGRVIKSNIEALAGATNQNIRDISEFSDSDIDRSPSRNRRSKRSSFIPEQKQPQNGPQSCYPSSNTSLPPQNDARSSRKSSGVNTSYNLDETVMDLETHSLFVRDNQIRPLGTTPEINNRSNPYRRTSNFSRGDANTEPQAPKPYESTRYSNDVTTEPGNSTASNHSILTPPSPPSSSKEDLKTFRCSMLSFLFFAVIVTAIGVAIYFREPCVGEHCASFVKVEERLKKMSAIAAGVVGNHECGYSDSKDLRIIDMTFDRNPKEVLEFALKNQASLNFQILDASGEVVSSDGDLRKAEKIRSTMSSKTPWCRFRQSFTAVTLALFYLVLGLFGIVGLAVIVKIYLYRHKKYMKRVDELVRGITSTVKMQASKNPPYIPIAHVRDRLLTSEEKKCNSRIWDRAVTFLNNNESRLRTENQIIKGEEYMVWHWVSLDDDEVIEKQPPKSVLKNETHELAVKPTPITVTNVKTTSETRSDPESIEVNPRVPTGEDMEVPSNPSRPTSKQGPGNVSQKARRSITLGPCSGWSNYDRSFIEIYPPTRCLKLKNLALVETGNAGLDIAKASVIERIQKHNFTVYSVDCDHRSEETAVYICCVDTAQAADIYKLFFEQKYNGETVQVKFLKLEKYLERFPFLRNIVG